jgi:ABC-type glutathione transport system ATPase component
VPLRLRVADGGCGKKRLSVWVHGAVANNSNWSSFHNLAAAENDDSMRDVANHRQIVGNKQVAELQPILKVLEQVEHLGLHRKVKGARWLVADYEAWLRD